MSHYSPGAQGLLAPLEPWLNDAEVSEILLNVPGEIWAEKKGQLENAKVPELTPMHLTRLFQLVANENHDKITAVTPLLSGSLSDGSRVQLVVPPTAKHHAFSIRRKTVNNFTLDNYNQQNFYSQAVVANLEDESIDALPESEKNLIELFAYEQWDEFIKSAILLKKNIVISGGTSSGKTTYLNACLRHIDNSDRIITLEDTREIETPHPNQVQLLASKGEQGMAKVTMQDLVQCCLRLRPDRIIMGEIRGAEIMDFVSACSTGHEGSITSIHANNPRIAFMRMTQMYKLNNVPSMSDADILRELHSVIDIVFQIGKTTNGRKGISWYYRYGHLAEEVRKTTSLNPKNTVAVK